MNEDTSATGPGTRLDFPGGDSLIGYRLLGFRRKGARTAPTGNQASEPNLLSAVAAGAFSDLSSRILRKST
ncbi:hypothetical protein [Bradyrhizobium elkanii]|uniref:hypothetical protein n=1 Tax=Bradyrhizobium elkanii TaxID=29448 RepID=UPI0022278F16|nr:hypothetical protein [Bradyrhizobium elkanii]MCW2227230.1 hypothetical protein [Bradyrhizobium elkanii]WLB77153.1 hypothetical protein QIH83_22330 [Bradyrhizobium elkanii]